MATASRAGFAKGLWRRDRNSGLTDAATEAGDVAAALPISDEPLPFIEIHNQLLGRLAGPVPATADRLYARLVGVPGWLESGVALLHARIRTESGASSLESAFLDMLLRNSETSCAHFRTIVKIFELGAATNRGEETYQAVRAAIAGHAFRGARFSSYDLLNMLPKVEPRKFSLLAQIKYGSVATFASENVFELARELAERIDLPFGLEDRLFPYAGNMDAPRAFWNAQVRQAFALDTLFADRTAAFNALREESGPAAKSLVETMQAVMDMDALRRGFNSLDPSKGTLFVSLHGGFVNLIGFAFLLGSKDTGFMLGRQGGDKVISIQDPRAALFRGIRAIEDGQSVFVAADARAGKYNASLSVLGVDVPMADGAPFIAYETGCETLWLGIERNRDRFAPQFVRGPFRRDGEKFADFRQRWLAFYANQIERLLTGDPASLTLRSQWSKTFSKGVDPRQIVP